MKKKKRLSFFCRLRLSVNALCFDNVTTISITFSVIFGHLHFLQFLCQYLMTVEAQRKAIFIYLLSLTDSILVSYFFRTFLCIFQSLLQFLTFIFLFFRSLLYFFVILFLSSVSPYSFLVFPSPLFSYSLYFPHMFLPHSSLSEKFISHLQFLPFSFIFISTVYVLVLYLVQSHTLLPSHLLPVSSKLVSCPFICFFQSPLYFS